jgi:Ca2+-binding EF-hand superfamily protein
LLFFLETKMASRKTTSRRTTTKKRAQRATSNVFAMFDQAQIQEFKEAFNMIDQNRDGFVDKEDLHDMLASLGKYSMLQNQAIHILYVYIC